MADGTDKPRPANPHRLIGELRVTDGPDVGRMFAVRDDAVLGRDDSADIVLVDTTGQLSRRHVRIGVRDGAATLEDLESTNGTFLNDERLTDPRPLRTGDRIKVGANTLEFTPAPEPEFTLPRGAGIDLTRARDIPTDQTRARDIPTDLTRARDIPTDVTRARDIPTDVTRARDIPTDVTRARDIPTDLTRQRRSPGREPPPPELPPTYAPPGADGQLRILSGPGAGATAPVIAGSSTIGREPECDLQVLDSEASRRHAKVTVRDGEATLDDLHSSNGTYVNGERILGSYKLAPEDRIQIGEATIELTSPVFAGAAVRTLAPQPSGLREVFSPKVLGAESGNRKWWTLAVVCTTVFMLLLDVTIVAVALPTISAALHPSFSQLQWIVDAYALMLAAALLTAGSFADIFGRKRVLTYGLIIFTIASVVCAQAPTATVLDLARGVQGIGGATMFACSLALIVQEFPAGERALAFGAYGAVNGLSVALGPIVGGLLVQGIGWQAIFYLNVPIAALCFFVLQRKVVNLPGPPTKIDWGGVVTFTLAMFLAIFATIRGNDEGWTSALILACYAGAIVMLALFVAVELRNQHPMFDLSLFRNPTFVGSSVSAFTVCFSVLALIFFLTTWLQSVLGFSPVGTGLRMLVFTGVALIAAPFAGRMTGTVSPRIVLTISLFLVTVGAVSMSVVSGTSAWTVILPGLVLAGVGLGLINPTLASTAVSVVPPWRGGMASGINSTCREAGTSVGIAVLGTLLQHQVSVSVHHSLAGTPLASHANTVASAIATGGTPQLVASSPVAFRPQLITAAHHAYAAGLHTIFMFAAGVAAIGCITAVSLVRRKHMIYAGDGGH